MNAKQPINHPLIIPAIDLKNGECVRLKQGKMEESKSYSTNPVEMAKYWQDKGANRIHIVDLDGAFAGQPKNLHLIETIARKLSIDIQVGGGIRSKQIAKNYINAGVSQVIVGTRAIENPNWFIQLVKTLPDQVILGLDAFGTNLAVKGWQEKSNQDLLIFAKQFDSLNLFAIIYTDISRDGMLLGINWQQTSDLAKKIKTPVIASGGLSNMDDIVALKDYFKKTNGKLFAAIAGKSLYERTIDFTQAKNFLESQSI